MLALHDTPARRWEPRRLRFRLFATAGRIVRGGLAPRLAPAGHRKGQHQGPWNPAGRSDIRAPALPAVRKDDPASRSGHRAKVTKHRG
jgi:hypothetical protein